ncbi:MAG: hypothetical protein EPN88_06965 [Bacteroidetes bacterium]|nr:MAG: hypothetical protein EPN88_06965 [Bacteroidota bacterium]
MKKLLTLSISVLVIGILSVAFTGSAVANTNIKSNVEALLEPQLIDPIVCHEGCRGTYPNVVFCVMCYGCRLIMYSEGIGDI